MSKRLLLIDDDTLFTSLVGNELIQNQGWVVRIADAIPTAVQALDEEERPDLVLLDLRFSSGSGFDVLDHLREKHAAVPVVVVTNFPHSTYGEKCAGYGVREYIVKPEWKINRLIGRIVELAA